MLNAIIVGKYFLLKNKELTDMQIQKLVYYAYAWYMIKNSGDKIFEEKPEAWVHGPVFKSLYDSMKSGEFYSEKSNEKLKPEMKKFLDLIYKIYGKYSGNELENMTHSELPWKNAISKEVRKIPRRRSKRIAKIFPEIRPVQKIIDKDILAWGRSSIN